MHCGYDVGALQREDKGVPAMTNAALRTLLPIAGWPETRADAVEITGGSDPVLPMPVRAQPQRA